MPLPLKMEVLRFWNDSSLILVRYKSERKCDHEMGLMRGTFSTSPAVAFHFAFSSKSKIEFQKTPKVS